MRSSTAVLIAAPAVVFGQALTTITGRVQTATITDSAGDPLYTSTWTYSNPATNYLSETNSDGVVTGMPSGSADMGQPAAVTSQPAVATIPAGLSSVPVVATIPAGLPTGVTQILYNGTAGFTSFSVSVGSSTTMVIGASPTDASIQTGGASQTGSGSSGSGSGSNSDNDSDSNSGDANASESASASQSGNAASSIQVAGAGIGFFAFIAALL